LNFCRGDRFGDEKLEEGEDDREMGEPRGWTGQS
jgi:hypothetical protein